MDQNQQSEQDDIGGIQKSAKLIWGIAIFLIIIMVFVYEIYSPKQIYATRAEIAPGMGSRQIAELLKREGIIRSKWIFVTYVSLIGAASDLKPGEYTFRSARSVRDIVRDLLRGGALERTITIPEGWTAKEIGEYFEKENILSRDAWEKATGPGSAVRLGAVDFLPDIPDIAGLEGYLFPDTYRIFIGSSAEEIVAKMLENFGKKVTPELRQEVFLQKKTLYEIVTMASLIEKEVVSEEDRALVSGILWKRIKSGMPLQVDATIAYIKRQMTNNTRPMSDNYKVSIEDTKIDSPYNTYKYRGLPKGPVSNPGISAIRAATYPKESPYLYYLSASDGRTIFSKTLEEHNKAKARYLTR